MTGPAAEVAGDPEPAPAARRSQAGARKEAAARRRAAERRRKRTRTIALLTVVFVVLAGFIFLQVRSNRRQTSSSNAFAAAAGCSKVQKTDDAGAGQHLDVGQTTKYDTSPPTAGAHTGTQTVPAGVYDTPLSEADQSPTIYAAVHSLEHGYVILWHKGLDEKTLDTMENKFGDEKKVIIAPYPKLKSGQKLALTAWGRLQTCPKFDGKVVDSFIDRFREARSAPEPNNA